MAQLTELLRFARDGDTVVVHSMDRLAGNLDDLRALVQGLTRKRVRVEFIKGSLVFTGEDSPMPTSCSPSWAPSPNSNALSSGTAKGKALPRPSSAAPTKARKNLHAGTGGRTGPARQQRCPEAVRARDYGISRESVYQYLRQVRLS